MTTKKQIITIAIAAALMAASTLMPEAADANGYRRPRHTRTNSAPEVDPSTVSSALALAVGGLAVLSDKLRRRR